MVYNDPLPQRVYCLTVLLLGWTVWIVRHASGEAVILYGPEILHVQMGKKWGVLYIFLNLLNKLTRRLFFTNKYTLVHTHTTLLHKNLKILGFSRGIVFSLKTWGTVFVHTDWCIFFFTRKINKKVSWSFTVYYFLLPGLENSVYCIVHEAAKSRTRLTDCHYAWLLG